MNTLDAARHDAARAAGHDADRAATSAGVAVRDVAGVADTRRIGVLFNTVWGRPATLGPMITTELLIAAAHAGNQVTIAEGPDGELLGATYAFLGSETPGGAIHLHSHITGVAVGGRSRGVGYALKLHQRAWAIERAIADVRWTFDPLVARNAWFNLGKLGAGIAAYAEDRYGRIEDATNAGLPSDRLIASWLVGSDRVAAALAGSPPELPDGATRVSVPHDIEALRRDDLEAAAEAAARVRRELGGALAAGATVAGFHRDGWYAVSAAARVPGEGSNR